ncbi:PREDICTED: uncharacterized protein LOC109189631 [Ipomoea nil]|uniref:uncharacterized protein LOC109189631 n=1 Tax=Ipomoea nil TaxID=35883 RepID=UPI0009013687|nr:PREDICTED: uncharacterized protein LOC109189631 [Ipomoea nil]
MANGWIKSLQCKSKVLDDVVSSHNQYRLLRNSGSCKNGVRSLKDVVKTAQERRPKKFKQPNKPPPLPPPPPPISAPGIESDQTVPRSTASTSARHARTMSESYFPALTELPEGHASRNVVEIIFHTSWSPKAFSGRIEVLFKVQNLPRTVARFEEYREAVKSRAASCGGGEDRARCVADGNEVMRFFCLGPTAGGAYETGGCSGWSLNSGKGTTICTYSGSGGAHESGGAGRGRRAMLVCRVIAGRVYQQLGKDSILEEERVGYDSVSGDNGELLVFDSRAVLPCFLIIYKI